MRSRRLAGRWFIRALKFAIDSLLFRYASSEEETQSTITFPAINFHDWLWQRLWRLSRLWRGLYFGFSLSCHSNPGRHFTCSSLCALQNCVHVCSKRPNVFDATLHNLSRTSFCCWFNMTARSIMFQAARERCFERKSLETDLWQPVSHERRFFNNSGVLRASPIASCFSDSFMSLA